MINISKKCLRLKFEALNKQKMEEYNMTTGIDLKLECVKFKNHQKNDEKLEEMIYQTNDIIYFFSRKIISPKAKDYILSNFERIGRTVGELQDSPRKNELLTSLRHYYKVVRNAEVNKPSEADKEHYIKLLNYCIAKSIKAKNCTVEEIMKQLDENKLVFELYVSPYIELYNEQASFVNFRTIQGELLRIIGNKFKLEDEY